MRGGQNAKARGGSRDHINSQDPSHSTLTRSRKIHFSFRPHWCDGALAPSIIHVSLCFPLSLWRWGQGHLSVRGAVLWTTHSQVTHPLLWWDHGLTEPWVCPQLASHRRKKDKEEGRTEELSSIWRAEPSFTSWKHHLSLEQTLASCFCLQTKNTIKMKDIQPPFSTKVLMLSNSRLLTSTAMLVLSWS